MQHQINEMKPNILITSGDPSGIGPEVILKSITADHYPFVVLIGSDDLYRKQYAQLYTQHPINIISQRQPHQQWQADRLNLINIESKNTSIELGKSNTASANLAEQYLQIACNQIKAGHFSKLITGPVCKQTMRHVIPQFNGHTEYLAKQFDVNDVRMLMFSTTMKVALVTMHLPLSQVSQALSIQAIVKTIELLAQFLQQHQSRDSIRIAVAGLNPHAGEQGSLGDEEINIITPAIHIARQSKINVEGPFPPDTIFRQYADYSAIVAMYHDQGLIPFKLLYFDQGINITLGLPFIRLSVDHGTALNIAGKNKANPKSFMHTLNWAINLT